MSNPASQRPFELISYLSGTRYNAIEPHMIESLKRGEMYDICLEILRTHMAAGKKILEHSCVAHMDATVLGGDALEFAAAVALSKPTMDYDELLSYALTLNEEKEIRNSLGFMIDKFGYRPSFYHYLISQESNDEALIKLFELDVLSAAHQVAIHCDLAVMKRLSRLSMAKDEKTLIGQTIAAIPYDQTSRIRLKLTGSTTMSNFEFTSRMDKFFCLTAGILDWSEGEGANSSSTVAEMKALPDFQAKMDKNAGTVVNLFYRAVKSSDAEDKALALEEVEKALIVPLLQDPAKRMSMFFTYALSKSDSWIDDVMESPDGGRGYYLQMLLDYVAKDKNSALGIARAFVRFEPVRELLALCNDDATLVNLHKLTSNKAFLQKASSKGRDRMFGGDLGL